MSSGPNLMPAPLPVLDEDEKRAVELLVQGRPKTHIAKELGIHRQTLKEMLDRPHVQLYASYLAEEQVEAQAQTLAGALSAGIEALTSALNHAQRQYDSGTPGPGTPTVNDIATAVRGLVDATRLVRGRPTSISQHQHVEGEGLDLRKAARDVRSRGDA